MSNNLLAGIDPVGIGAIQGEIESFDPNGRVIVHVAYSRRATGCTYAPVRRWRC